MARKSKKTENLTATDTLVKKHSQIGEMWRRFASNRLALAGLIIIVLLLLMVIFANLIAPYDPTAQNISERLQLPSAAHWMGTDNYGRDLLSRLIYGGRVSLLISMAGLLIALVIGGILGAVAGYFGGICDQIIMRLMDILMAIPGMLMAVMISALLGGGAINTAIAISIGGIAPSARLLRSNVMTMVGQEYVEAAKAQGEGNLRVILRQILPNTLSPVIVDCTLRLGANILQISMLSFIGLGVQPPTPEWGSIMNVGREYIMTFYPMLLFPGIFILLSMFGFNVMGDGLRDALDPKMKD